MVGFINIREGPLPRRVDLAKLLGLWVFKVLVHVGLTLRVILISPYFTLT